MLGVTIGLSMETVERINAYQDYMDKIDKTMPADLQCGPMVLQVAVLTLIKEGLKAVEERMGK